jgi:hypothetical protein
MKTYHLASLEGVERNPACACNIRAALLSYNLRLGFLDFFGGERVVVCCLFFETGFLSGVQAGLELVICHLSPGVIYACNKTLAENFLNCLLLYTEALCNTPSPIRNL